MDITFRELTSKDIFPMCRIISKIGVQRFRECFSNAIIDRVKEKEENAEEVAEENAEEVGVNVFFNVLELIADRLPACESEIFKLLADVGNTTPEELAEMPMVEFAEVVGDFVQKQEFRDFIKVASKWLNLEK